MGEMMVVTRRWWPFVHVKHYNRLLEDSEYYKEAYYRQMSVVARLSKREKAHG